jgi:hypothetical protein
MFALDVPALLRHVATAGSVAGFDKAEALPDVEQLGVFVHASRENEGVA